MAAAVTRWTADGLGVCYAFRPDRRALTDLAGMPHDSHMTPPSPTRIRFHTLVLSGLLALSGPCAATEPEATVPDDAKAKLRALQQAIDESEQERLGQRAALRQLERQMNCNWDLIRTYELCEQLHADHADDLAACTARARNRARTCLQVPPDKETSAVR